MSSNEQNRRVGLPHGPAAGQKEGWKHRLEMQRDNRAADRSSPEDITHNIAVHIG
jgi:hypothetical protein